MAVNEGSRSKREAVRQRFSLRRIAIIIVVALIHVAVFLGLLRAFDVDIVPDVVQSITSFAVPADPPAPEPEQTVDETEPEGASGAEAERARPREVSAPPPKIPPPKPSPAPPASADGIENRSGAADAGSGTGGGGPGMGPGSGGRGTGSGGGIAVKPSVRSGNLDTASDFSVPPGGRETRFGKSVTVQFTVTADGRARNCSVLRSTVDAQTAAETCPLVLSKIRFNPARNAAGQPVEARYGYRVDFTAR